MRERSFKLDMLKAIAIVLVLIWHLRPIRIYPIGNPTIPLAPKLLNLMYHLTLVAVPTFYFVSLFLFFKKTKISDYYIMKRLKKILIIFLSWGLVQIAFYYLVKLVSFLLRVPFHEPESNSKYWWWIVMGGPSLPEVGDSVFYFLFNLMLLVLLSSLYLKIATKSMDIILFVLLSLYLYVHQFFFVIPFWRIDNFIIYLPMAHLLSTNYYPKILSWKFFLISIFIYILFFLSEILCCSFLHVTMHSAYDINSLQWGVVALYIIVYLKSWNQNNIVKWLSKYSLGLFALHKYFLLIFLSVFSGLENKLVIDIGNTQFRYFYIAIFAFTIISTCGTILWFRKKSFLKVFIS